METTNAARRSSGRTRKQPEIYSSSPASNGKRKRADVQDDDAEMQDEVERDSEAESESEVSEPDEEERREQSRKARKTKNTTKKPAQKKPKTNGTGSALPFRDAPAKARKRAPKRGKAVNTQDAEEAGGLFAEVFAGDDRLENVAANWIRTFEQHQSQAIADVVTFVLKCAGCDGVVTAHDIEDPDGCTNRLTDLQDEFQATAPTEYPLIAKKASGQAFKDTMNAFFIALIKSVAANGKLYNEPLLIDNIEVWLSTMSSAGNRAFRHTATVASLAIISGMAEVAAERAQAAADWQLQANDLRSKKNHNKARAKDLDQRVQEATSYQDFLETQIKDWFEAVFIHRYRDVDPAIRRDCAIALADWVVALPTYFFDSKFLRYLGWVLSDTVAATRIEVVKQLQRLYKEKDKVSGLRTFTERFRPRMIEIATTDSDTNVRVAGIELLDLLRDNGLLEPDDIDAIGRLIYDSDHRVRKAVSSFFAENVNDLYNSKIDDLGGLENLEESLPEIDEDTLDSPRLQWLKFKSLAEMMAAYDVEEEVPANVERSRDGGLVLQAGVADSRFTLAGDALYNKVDEIQDWESLAGYLLFDHSSGRANGAGNDAVSQLMHESALAGDEEVILLELVSASVKHAISNLAEKAAASNKKLTKKQKEELNDEQEDAARQLATVIPKLLKKFGDAPSTAAAVLRMESVLNLPSMRGLRQDTLAYGALLDDIRKQFMSHGTDEVLGPASEAILHAKSYGELDDLTEEKLTILWEDVINNLVEQIDPKTATVRGVSNAEQLVAISNDLLRITRLAQVSNCTSALEDSSIAEAHNAKDEEHEGAIDYIIDLIQRALPSSGPELEPEDVILEDQVAVQAAEAALRYLQWKFHLIMEMTKDLSITEIPYAELEALATRRDQFVNNLDSVLQVRKPGDAVSMRIAECMLELHTSAVILKNIKARPGMRDDWEVLIMNLHPSFVKMILKVFSAAEKNFAVLSNKKIQKISSKELEVEDINADPVDDEPLSESEDDSEDEASQTQASQLRKENRLRKTVLAEKALCELAAKMIFAIHAGVDNGSMRKRLEMNRLKLGPNYKELLVYLDVGQATKNKAKVKSAGKAKANGVAAKTKANPKSNAIVAEDEVDDEIEDVDSVVGQELELEADEEEE